MNGSHHGLTCTTVDVNCTFSAKRMEIDNEAVPESEPHRIGLKISRCIDTEEAKEVDWRGTMRASWGDIPRIGGAQGTARPRLNRS
jgi:hypothetical protein